MYQKDQMLRKILADKNLEYKFFVEKDKNSLEEENRKKIEKFKYLTAFRDENKQVWV
jgi:hypothetical protein